MAAAGVPGMITPDMVKPGAAVLDVGVSRVIGEDGKKRVVGDMHPERRRGGRIHLARTPAGSAR